MKRLLIYMDTLVFGGHEMMLMRHIENSLLDQYDEIHLLYHEANQGIGNLLLKITAGRERLFPQPVSWTSKPLQRLRDPRLDQKTDTLAALFDGIDPDQILVAQGNIELGSLGLLAAARTGRKLASYIPLGHGFKQTGQRLGWLRDLANRRLYTLPDRFITIGESQKRMLTIRGVPAEKIAVVPNFIEISPATAGDRPRARSLLGLPEKAHLFGVIGRIQFCHKAQDFLLRTFAGNISRLPECALVVVGSGPDERKLRTLTARLGIDKQVFFFPWQEDIAPIYDTLDALVIPSRLEGVPLVMLEAIELGLPVLASGIDGMAENLPSPWLFRPADPGQLVERLRFVLDNDQRQLIEATRNSFHDKFNRHQARLRFREALKIPAAGACSNREDRPPPLMKIALDLTSLCRPLTGTERVAIGLSRELVRHDDIHFFLLFRKRVHEEFAAERQNVTRFVSPFRSQFLTEQVWLPYKINALAPDFAHYPFFPPGLFSRHPFVITIHDANLWIHKPYLSLKTKLYTKPLLHLALGRARHIFLSSGHFMDDLAKNTNVRPENITVTGMGITNEFFNKVDAAFTEAIRRKYRLDFSFILMVGTIEPRKNHLNMLQVIQQNRDWFRTSGRKLVVIGRRGWAYAEFKEAVERLQVQDLIVMPGHVSDHELAAFYHLAECLIFPSFYEGYGLPVLEAFACGLPVVCAAIQPLQDIARNAAFFVDPGDVRSIANGMLAVYEHEHEKQAHIRQGREIAARHSWQAAAEIVTGTYRALAARAHKATTAGTLPKSAADPAVGGWFPTRTSVNIMGANLLRIKLDELVSCIMNMISGRQATNMVITANVDHLYKISKDREFSDIYLKSKWIVTDGMPLVWVSRLLGEPVPCRINGTDLMEHLCKVAADAGLSIFLFGGRSDLAQRCRDALLRKHPRLQVKGAVSPSDDFRFPSSECDAIVETIRSARPDILFVGLGSPKQEKWLFQYLDRLAVPVSIGVGASFSFISGRLKRAPKFIQTMGLEWFWRLLNEPKRLFKRYLFSNIYFMIKVNKILARRVFSNSRRNP